MKKKTLNKDKVSIAELKIKLSNCQEEKRGLQELVNKLKNVAHIQPEVLSKNKPIDKVEEILISKETELPKKEDQIKSLQSDDVFAQISKCILFAQLIGLKKKLTPTQLQNIAIIQAFEAKEQEITQGIWDNRKK